METQQSPQITQSLEKQIPTPAHKSPPHDVACSSCGRGNSWTLDQDEFDNTGEIFWICKCGGYIEG